MNALMKAPLEPPKPYDLTSEQQLLGALLVDNGAAEALLAFLLPEHFAEPLHQRIYDAIVRAVKAGEAASPFTLKAQFACDFGMRGVGGPQYLVELAALARECVDVAAWGRALYGLSFRRTLIAAAREIQDIAFTAGVDADAGKIADVAERLLSAATESASSAGIEKFRSIGGLACEVTAALGRGEAKRGVSFGLGALDDLTGGAHAKELIIVGARPGMGKTAFAGHLALAAAQGGHAVAFFSMEMAASAVTLRLIAARAFAQGRGVAYDAARRGALASDQMEALFAAEASLSSLPLYVHEGRTLTPSGLLLAARRVKKRMRDTATPLGLVIVDHLQKIRPERDCRGNKVAEMTEISDALQKMAGTLDVPVVALSQLNRAVEGRGGERRPELSDLRESGAIEQDADVVLLLYREAYYVKKREPHRLAPEWTDWFAEWRRCQHVLDVHVAKQRNGQEGHLRVHFDGASSGIR
jgi:replicative DNA helicase